MGKRVRLHRYDIQSNSTKVKLRQNFWNSDAKRCWWKRREQEAVLEVCWPLFIATLWAPSRRLRRNEVFLKKSRWKNALDYLTKYQEWNKGYQFFGIQRVENVMRFAMF